MEVFYLLLFFLRIINGKLPDFDKVEFCENLECDESDDREVCGVRYEEDEVIFKLFKNECKLLQYGCQVDDSLSLSPGSRDGYKINLDQLLIQVALNLCNLFEPRIPVMIKNYPGRTTATRIMKPRKKFTEEDLQNAITAINNGGSVYKVSRVNNIPETTLRDKRDKNVVVIYLAEKRYSQNRKKRKLLTGNKKSYGIIGMKHCGSQSSENIEHVKFLDDSCPNCASVTANPVCGIRKYGEGFKIKSFENECLLKKYNCNYDLQFTVTDFFICANNQNVEEYDAENEQFNAEEPPKKLKELPEVTEEKGKRNVIKTKSLFVIDGSLMDARNINKSIDNFFATTHDLDLPVRNLDPMLNETTRRRIIRIFGPVTVFQPWTTVPENISDDYYHLPTINSCYHKCPKKCPDTYAPVCAVPGLIAREPSLMFRNHCYLDVAQCKMFWEGKSFTSQSSNYVESAFMFCLGEELQAMYRFLPFVRSLQHMGRIKKKGNYKYRSLHKKFMQLGIHKNIHIMG